MPREGVFARVIQGGKIAVVATMAVRPRTTPFPFQAAVITLSDRCAAGGREDKRGPAVAEQLERAGFAVVEQLLLADEREPLERNLIRLCDQRQLDLILTTGGTALPGRDITPEATRAVADQDAPGIIEPSAP